MDSFILKTNNKNRDFMELIALLDEDLNERNGESQKLYDEFNKVDKINDVFVLYKYGIPVGCGAFKKYDDSTVEVKRVFVKKDFRKQGLSKVLMNAIENSAMQKGYTFAILETGVKQFEAIALYKKCGYEVIENFGQYVNNVNSVCMKKKLKVF